MSGTTTSGSCPVWCDLPAGHGYDSIDGTGFVFRCHRVEIATGIGYGTFGKLGAVEVSSLEMGASDDGPVVETDPPVIMMFGVSEGDDLTGPQARKLAAALLLAADEWDRLK